MLKKIGLRYSESKAKVTEMDKTLALDFLPFLIAEVERLREQVKEYQEALKPFARPFISESDNDDLEVGFSGITIRDYRRAKALLEKE